MKVNATIQKWGNSLALRISGPMRDIPHFTAGMQVAVDVSARGLKIKKVAIPKGLPYSEDELLEDISPENAHIDIVPNIKEGEY